MDRQTGAMFSWPYTGSFGIIEDSGDLRLNLIIRSMLILESDATPRRAWNRGGFHSEYEYRENQIKAQALLDLLS